MSQPRDYDQIILHLFRKLYQQNPNADRLEFTKDDIVRVINELGLIINNVPDVAYTYRTGRSSLPAEILALGNWAIDGTGKGRYVFTRLTRSPYIDIPTDLETTSILDSTPQIVLKYQNSLDEQEMLARVRYNRIVDIFTSLTTYHLQGHFRTTVSDVGQVEIDDLYIGIDTDGIAFLLPVEAKAASPKDQLGVVQITQMVKFGRQHFPELVVRPIGIKLLTDGSLIFIEMTDAINLNDVRSKRYKRYRLYRER